MCCTDSTTQDVLIELIPVHVLQSLLLRVLIENGTSAVLVETPIKALLIELNPALVLF